MSSRRKGFLSDSLLIIVSRMRGKMQYGSLTKWPFPRYGCALSECAGKGSTCRFSEKDCVAFGIHVSRKHGIKGSVGRFSGKLYGIERNSEKRNAEQVGREFTTA